MGLRVGIIGLGRRWRRYRPQLARLRNYLEVRAVCDQVHRRAETVSRQLGCLFAAGPVELLERADVEAVLLLDRQWYGLWPLMHACQVKKPVFCALSLGAADTQVDGLAQQIHESELPVLMGVGSLLAPATRFVRELLTHRLGQARLVRAEACLALPQGKPHPRILQHPTVLSLLAACAWLLDDVPRSVWTIEGDGSSFVTLVLRFGSDRVGQVTCWTATAGKTPMRFEIVAENGTALVELPRQLLWRDADGQHAQQLPLRSTEQSAPERFLVSLRAGQPLRPSFTEVYQALTWLRAAQRSQSEGVRIVLPKPELGSANAAMPSPRERNA
jgi:predicted dehydrogenase